MKFPVSLSVSTDPCAMCIRVDGAFALAFSTRSRGTCKRLTNIDLTQQFGADGERNTLANVSDK